MISNNKFNKNVQNTFDEMKNTMRTLYDKKILDFYNEPKLLKIDGKEIITWENHVSGRENCDSSFTMLKQYSHILTNNSFHCIVSDGSIFRSSFEFEGKKLISHSHLWWPSPYSTYNFPEELSHLDRYEDFVSNHEWDKIISMRTPVRIDFSPKDESEEHPLVHMHTQNHECRIKLYKPICFSTFVNYIFRNFYSNISFNFDKLNLLNFSYNSEQYDNADFASIKI